MRLIQVVVLALILCAIQLVTCFLISRNAVSVAYDGVYTQYSVYTRKFSDDFLSGLSEVEKSSDFDFQGSIAETKVTVDGKEYDVYDEARRQTLTTSGVAFFSINEICKTEVAESDKGTYAIFVYPDGDGTATLKFKSISYILSMCNAGGLDNVAVVRGTGRIVSTLNVGVLSGNLSDYDVSLPTGGDNNTVTTKIGVTDYVVSVYALGDTGAYIASFSDFTSSKTAISHLERQNITTTLLICAFTLLILIFGVFVASGAGMFSRYAYRIIVNADGKIIKSDRSFKEDFPDADEIREKVTRFDEYGTYAIKISTSEGDSFLSCNAKRRNDGTVLLFAKKLDIPIGDDISLQPKNSMEDIYNLMMRRNKNVFVGEIKITNLRNIKTMFGRAFSNKVRSVIMSKLQEKNLIVCEIDYYTMGILYAGNLKHFMQDLPDIFAYINRPVQIDNDLVTVGVKGGCCVSDKNQETRFFSYIIDYVEAALKRATSDKEHDYFIYDESQKKIYAKYFFKIDIKQMLKNDDFEMHYQPQYSLKEDKIIGFEALFRVTKRVELNAGAFEIITYAERSGNMVLLGDFIFDTSMKFAKTVENMGVTVSLNVSPVQLMQAGFVDRFLQIYRKYDIKPGVICVEVTESFLMTTFEETVQKLEILKKNGILVHLDDFGTDYSSLLYLKKLPIDTIKVDKEFVTDICENEYSKAITKLVINIAHELKLTSICEGIETYEQLEIVRSYDCDVIQGFIVGKAMEADVAREMITTFKLEKKDVA
jgi:EAL domain-containing protein (putative c-di-GMP-specific phosphodiesterase class I)